MGAQFAHIQTFSRKKNKVGQCVDQVIGELLREALYSGHVPEPARRTWWAESPPNSYGQPMTQ